MRRKSVRLQSHFFYAVYFLLYGLSAIIFYELEVQPYLERSDFFAPKLLADTLTYIALYRDSVDWTNWYWMRDAGPCLALQLFGGQVHLITIANVMILVIASRALARAYSFDSWRMLFYLTINPLTFFSIFGPNKEILGLIAVIWLLIYFRNRSVLSFILVVAFSFFARLPMLAVVLLFLLADTLLLPAVSPPGPVAHRRFVRTALLIVFVVSVVVYFAGEAISFELLGNVSAAQENSTSTLWSLRLDALSDVGFYVITYVVRLTLNLYGALGNIGLGMMASHGLYYAVGVMGSSAVFLIMTLRILKKYGVKVVDINPQGVQIVLFALFYSLLLCVSPVIQHRYYFPLYPILVVMILSWRGHGLRRGIQVAPGAVTGSSAFVDRHQ